LGAVPAEKVIDGFRCGEEAEDGETWVCMTEFSIRMSGMRNLGSSGAGHGLGASGVGFGLLCHREDLVV
jgi:hypothetical protein